VSWTTFFFLKKKNFEKLSSREVPTLKIKNQMGQIELETNLDLKLDEMTIDPYLEIKIN
jgi:hypothetical protein